MLPMFQENTESLEYVSPFQVEGSKLVPVKCTGIAFGVALCSLLFTLDNIELGRINWSNVIGDAIM
ncbi:MAG: hypothetical protein GY954_20330 [Alteromonas sp.]|nr:hypothetical protein [Alteromonas sp.]